MKVGDLQWPRRVRKGADEAGIGGPGNRGPERGWGRETQLTRKWASCKAIWMKLSEERWQRLMKLLPKWEKGKTWQSMSPDKVLAPLRAREMNRCIFQSRREEGVVTDGGRVRAGNGTGGRDGNGARVGVDNGNVDKEGNEAEGLG